MNLAGKKKVLLISSGQPSLNPRLVKEADALAEAGYDVTVFYAYWNQWGTAFDKKLIPSKKWKAICIGGDPKQKPATYFMSRLIHKASKIISQQSGSKLLARFAITRAGYLLSAAAKKHNADLYIGHNLGALPATVKAAKAHKKPCGFDAEDFHRREVSGDSKGDILKANIENEYFRELNYLSVSSPAIGREYSKLFKGISPVTILNVFPADTRVTRPEKGPHAALKLFWFSQTLSMARGISDCIKALQLLNNAKIELHLLGFAPERIKQQLTAMAGNQVNMKFYQPIPPDAIVPFAAQFDIGLAIEDNIPLNRDICLTNKIFTYMQAGLAIIATDTTAQAELMNTYPDLGTLYENGNVKMLADAIEHYFSNRANLNATKISAFELARKELSWEKERGKFLKVIKNILAG